MTLFEPKFGPGFSFGHSRVDVFFDDCRSDPSCTLDFFPVVVETVGDDCLGAIFVG